MKVVLCGRQPAALHATLALMDQPGEHLVVPADVTSSDDRRRVAATIAASWPALDVLVNNAGVVRAGPVSGVADETLEAIFATNAIAPIALTRDCLPLLANGKSPRVVNIGSVFGEIPYPNFAAYSASKAALNAYSSALRRELGTRGIAVTHVAPRATRTDAASVLDSVNSGASMKLDPPEKVAVMVWDAVARGRHTVQSRGPERFFVLLNKLFPQLIDVALSRSS